MGTACERVQRQSEHGPSMAQTSSSEERTQSAEGEMRLFNKDKECLVDHLFRGGVVWQKELGGHSKLLQETRH